MNATTKTKWPSQRQCLQLVSDSVLYALVLVLFWPFRADLVLIFTWFSAYPYFLLTKRRSMLKKLLLSTIFGCIWMTVAKNQIRYEQDFIAIGGFQLFVMFGWALGLMFAHLIYSHFREYVQPHNNFQERLLFSVIYCALLILTETISYHVFGIHNVIAQGHVGVPFFDCLHAPRWMQFSYFLTGPVYFVCCCFLWPPCNTRHTAGVPPKLGGCSWKHATEHGGKHYQGHLPI